jgi:hypothetical protein
MTAANPNMGALQFEAGAGWYQVSQPNNVVGLYFAETAQDGLTANAGGGQANATILPRMFNRVTTVATSGDSVKLPPAMPGADIMVINSGANPMAVFASGNDQIDGLAAGASLTHFPNSVVLYSCYGSGNWFSEGAATGYAGNNFQTLSYATGLTAHAGGGQGSATPLTGMLNFVSTVVTAGDSLLLPSAVPGMEVTVINQSSTATGPNVFPQSGQTINALAANTAIAVPPQSVMIFFCGISGAWWTK